jgi:hypothetical protein
LAPMPMSIVLVAAAIFAPGVFLAMRSLVLEREA